MYVLIDTFNNRTISRHRTLKNAVRAEKKHQRAVKRNNGQDSYIPTAIRDEVTGEAPDPETLVDLECRLAAE